MLVRPTRWGPYSAARFIQSSLSKRAPYLFTAGSQACFGGGRQAHKPASWRRGRKATPRANIGGVCIWRGWALAGLSRSSIRFSQSKGSCFGSHFGSERALPFGSTGDRVGAVGCGGGLSKQFIRKPATTARAASNSASSLGNSRMNFSMYTPTH
jgi:hypothetical protein